MLEEYGHYIDSQVNSSDTPGDEGAIFAALVLGEELGKGRLQELREEDDSAVVVIDGEEVQVEFNELEPGTIFYHPTLSSEEIKTLARFASAVYEDNVEVDGWEIITPELTPNSLEGNTYFEDPLGLTSFGDASAVVAKKQNTLILSFRGTDGLEDAIADIALGGFPAHYSLFAELFEALDNYIENEPIDKILVTGHSLGGAMVEMFMAENPGQEYSAVSFASPLASNDDEDERILNIGNENDPVYSIIGLRDDDGNSTLGINSVVQLTRRDNPFSYTHSVGVYEYLTQRILDSEFYDDMTRDSLVIVDRTNNGTRIENQIPFFSNPDAFILGENSRDDGFRGDDALPGGRGDDVIEALAGDDRLFGRGGSDELVGGSGNDLLAGGSPSSGDEIDTLRGGEGSDTLYLGNISGLYYDDEGTEDYAKIIDFEVGVDRIRYGGRTDFSDLSARTVSSNGVPLRLYYYQEDLIAVRNLPVSISASSFGLLSASNDTATETQFNLASNNIDFDNLTEIPDSEILAENLNDIFEFISWDEEDIKAIQNGLVDLLQRMGASIVKELVEDEKNVFLDLLIAESLTNDDFNFFGNIATALDGELNLASGFTPEVFVEQINQQLDSSGVEDVAISLIEDNGDEIIFGLSFSDSNSDSIQRDANLADLGLSFQGGMDFSLDTTAAINFGIDVDSNEFFVDTGLDRAIDINLNLENSEELKTTIGNFNIAASDRSVDSEDELFEGNTRKAFQASLNFGLDLDSGDGADGRLTADEIADSSFEPTLIGELNINPLLELNIDNLPSLDFDLDYNARYDFIDEKFVAPEEVVTADDNIAPPLFLNGTEVNSDNVIDIVADEVSELLFDNLGGLSEIINEIDSFLAQIANTLDVDAFGLDLPFLGNALSGNLDATGFINTIRNGLANTFQNTIDTGVETFVSELDSVEFVSAEITTNSDEEIVISVGLEGATDFDTNLAPDLGFLGDLGLDISANANIDLSFKLEDALEIRIDKTPDNDGDSNNDTDFIEFNFGNEASEDSGDNSPEGEFANPLEIDLSLNLPENTVFDGNLGFLDINLTSALGDNNSEENDFEFGLDIDLDTFDYRFDYPQLDDVRLFNLEVAVPDIEVDGLPTVSIPSFSTDLSFDFTALDDDNSDVESQISFSFEDVTIDAGSLYNDFIGSFIDGLDPVLDTVRPFTDAITADIAPLSSVDAIRDFFDNPQLSNGRGNGDGKVTLIEVATNPFISGLVAGTEETQEEPQYIEFLESVEEIASFVTTIDELDISKEGINLGSISFDDSSGSSMTPTYERTDASLTDTSEETDELVLPQGLSIPLFDDPLGTAFSIFTGDNVSLIEYDVPRLSFNTELSRFFPVVGPLGVRLGGLLSAEANLGFGFDTSGLLTGDQSQGFYVLDRHNDENNAIADLPEFALTARVTAEGGAELGVGRGFVGGNLTGNVYFDLVDPDNDGRIRLSEIGSDLSELFDVSAELTAGLQAWFEVGYGAFSIREDFDFGSITLLEN